jgi:hypothetical protein
MTLLTMDFCDNFVSHNCGYVCCGKKKSFIVHKSSLLRARVSGCSKRGGACLKSSKLLFEKSPKKIPPPPQKRAIIFAYSNLDIKRNDFHAMELAFAQYIINVQLS